MTASVVGSPSLWGVIPAAGSGQRMQSEVPKQYLALSGKAVLQRSIETLLAVRGLQAVVVALPTADCPSFRQLDACGDPRVQRVTGAAERAGSVAAGVAAVRRQAGDDVWVLVHDAARPLVALADIHRLIETVLASGAVGGLLGRPVQDTLKRAASGPVSERTVSRDGLWQAETPQLFRAGDLGDALAAGLAAMADDRQVQITDEASALERLGRFPLLVEARSPNPKITRPADLLLAEALLGQARE